MEDISIFNSKSLFFIEVLLGEVEEGVGDGVSFALLIINMEIILREFLGLADLARTQTFYIYELMEIVIIGKY